MVTRTDLSDLSCFPIKQWILELSMLIFIIQCFVFCVIGYCFRIFIKQSVKDALEERRSEIRKEKEEARSRAIRLKVWQMPVERRSPKL